MTPNPDFLTQPSRTTNELIAEAVTSLVEALNPMEIYLFGSHASGTATKGSDVDLLVVVRDGSRTNLANTRLAYDATAHLPVARDIVVQHESSFRRRASWVSSLEREVVETGILLYGKS